MARLILLVIIIFTATLGLLRWQAARETGADAIRSDISVSAAEKGLTKTDETAPPSQNKQAAAGQVVIRRDADSHFRTMVDINGVPIEMLVDSGATVIALSQRDAEKLGLFAGGPGDFTGTAQTAAGPVRFKPVMLSRVAIGPIEHRNVQAAILDADVGTSLLGQSFLGRIDKVTIKGDELILE